MEPMSEAAVRRSMVNCSRGEASRVNLPKDFPTLAWAELAALGWRDPKAPLRGYLVTRRGNTPFGLSLRAAESTMSGRNAAMCLLCHTVHTADLVSLFTASRLGEAGRNGNRVGTYICADLACSRHIREGVKPTRDRPDPSAEIADRLAVFSTRLDAFITDLLTA
jgi:hypothetical protein